MARDFIVNGECLVKVKGLKALASDDDESKLWELGLSVDEIRVIPRFIHQDIKCDDFGPEIPANVMWNLADVTIRMTLVHYDDDVLDRCIANSMGGQALSATGIPQPGKLVAAGTLLGSGGDDDCLITLNLLSPVLDKPWRFPNAYLNAMPLEIPLGTTRTMVQMSWRAIPFALGNNPRSQDKILWDFEEEDE